MYNFFSSILSMLFNLGTTSSVIIVFFTTLVIGSIAYYSIRKVISSLS